MSDEEECQHFLLIGAALARARKVRSKRRQVVGTGHYNTPQNIRDLPPSRQRIGASREEFKAYFRLNKEQF